MKIPAHVAACLTALEQAGYSAYVVGGCVRDACLGLMPHDYDICTSALPEETEAVFAHRKLDLKGKQHGTVVVYTEEAPLEITTYRTEGEYRDNRHPDWVAFVPEVEKDLARRDFTVNAMAYSPARGFADPFGGREDLQNGILRAVGEPVKRFREDSLRILRGARFAARFCLTVEPETAAAMASEAHLLDNLARERAFEELCKLITLATEADILRFAPVITAVIPELHLLLNDRCTARATAGVAADLVRRWAALLHGLGGEAAEAILLRLKAPTDLRQQAVFLIEHCAEPLVPEKKPLRRCLSMHGWEKTADILALQWAIAQAEGREDGTFSRIDDLLSELYEENPCLSVRDLALNGRDLMALGYRGKAVGETLNALLEQVLEEKTENTRQALLAALEAE